MRHQRRGARGESFGFEVGQRTQELTLAPDAYAGLAMVLLRLLAFAPGGGGSVPKAAAAPSSAKPAAANASVARSVAISAPVARAVVAVEQVVRDHPLRFADRGEVIGSVPLREQPDVRGELPVRSARQR